MDWNAVAAVGQMLGSIAVFVSVAYLAIQVRHARTEATRSIVVARNAVTTETAKLLIEQRDLRNVLRKARVATGAPIDPPVQAFMERVGLDPDEADIATAWCMRTYAQQKDSIDHADELSEVERQWSDVLLRRHYSSGIGAVWYEAVRFRLPPHVVRYIDNVLAEPR